MNIPIVKHSLKYNPSLDGIRGIAILLVLLFHIWPKTFSFGYLGVDLFFVLSGYLITRIIYTKLEGNSFSFKEFYRNRIRRIFPAVIIVLLFVLAVGWLFLFPSELKDLARHIKSSAFFYENFRLIGETGYWDKAAELKPLLHFWSLSVEEQFYLLWPLIIYTIYRLKLNLTISMLVLLGISLALRSFLDIDTFFHSLARFWELILGALLFALSYKENKAYEIKSKILSFYPLVFLGLISFPLYLWHYTIISYMHIFDLDVSGNGFWILLFSILISFLTYRYIEVYARAQQSYIFASFLFVVLLIIGLIGQYIYIHNGLPNRSHLANNDKFQKQFTREAAQNTEGITLVKKVLGYKPSNNYIKATSDDPEKKFIAIIGDSHAHTSYPGFAEEFKKRGYETVLIANSSCPPYIDGAMGKNLKDVDQCKIKIDNQYRFIDSLKNIEKVIFITRGPVYIYDIGYGIVENGGKPLNYHFESFFHNKEEDYNQKEKFFEVLERTFNIFNSKDKLDFYYLLENPELGFSPKNCMERPFGIFPTECKISFDAYMNRAGEYRNKVKKIATKYPKIHVLDPKDLYCDHSYCYAVKDGKMLYADDDHHSIDGSILQANYFMKQIFPGD